MQKLKPLGILAAAGLIAGCNIEQTEEARLPDVDVSLEDRGQLPRYDVDVEQTQEGRLPDVDVDVRGGQLPEFDVDAPDIDVGTREAEVDVPDIDVDVDTERETVTVPDVDVQVPEDEDRQ